MAPAPATAPLPMTPLADALDRTWDVAVVGAGPAGATTAAHLAAAGLEVVVLERAPLPRDKTCGDGLIADALHALAALGLGDAVRRLGRRIGRVSVWSPARVHVPVEGEFVTLRRRDLDALLQGAAAERGARLVEAAATAVAVEGPEGVELRVRGATAPLRARYVVLATGADLSLAAAHAGPRVDPGSRQTSAVAARCYVTSRTAVEDLVVSFDRTVIPGYAWIFPLGPDEAGHDVYNVGAGVFYGRDGKAGAGTGAVNLRAMLDRFLADFPLARALMAGAVATTRLEGARLRCGLGGRARVPGSPVVAVGETIGTTFPFTGEGVGKAMETGAIAARFLAGAVRGGGPAALDGLADAVEAELAPKYRGYEIAQRWLSHAWVNDFVARRVNRSPYLQRQVRGILDETADPRAVFSLRGLLPSLVR